jgi:hypothetical protein
MSFDDNIASWEVSLKTTSENTMTQGTTSDTNDGFLLRPVKICEFEWNVNRAFHESFNPWQLFFEDPRVINRLAHFRNMRSKLRLKFVLNGNAFYYGRLMAFYTPLHELDQTSISRPGVLQDFVEASQKLHGLLNPTTNQGCEIVLPFLFPKNFVSIKDKEWSQLGMITLTALNALQHTNGGLDPVSVNVFAYPEELEYNVPTNYVPEMEPQATIDEYSGPFSAPAHSIANISGKLSTAPIIGPYARATQMISSGVAELARLFGFSAPTVSESCKAVVRYVPNLATTNEGVMASKLTLDHKQEVTVDPRVTGAPPEDEMALVPLAMRESYVDRFRWYTADAPETLLFNVQVTPAMYDTYESEYHMTPSCWVSNLFNYWTGSMEFRFQVVASAYHKGRIRIVWDPIASLNNPNSYNTNYNEIVDISEVTDFTVRVGWGQPTNYLKFSGGNFGSGTSPTGIVPYGPDDSVNGVLSVYVVNTLTTPANLDSPIEVNVYTKMCDDFEVAVPGGDRVKNYDLVSGSIQDDLPGGLTSHKLTMFPAAISHRDDTDQEYPQQSIVNNYGQQQLLRDGNTTLHVFYYRQLGEDALDPITFTFNNPTSTEGTLALYYNGNATADDFAVLPGQIGGSASLTYNVDPTTLNPGVNYLKFTIDNSGISSRVYLQQILTRKPVDWSIVTAWGDAAGYFENQFLGPGNFGTVDMSGGYFAGTSSIDGWSLRSPFNAAPGTLVNLSVRNGNLIHPVSITGNTKPLGEGRYLSMPADDPSYKFETSINDENTEVLSISFLRDDTIVPQALIEPQADIEPEPAPDVAPTVSMEPPDSVMAPPCVSGPTNTVYFGEQCSSWRQLLKRDNRYLREIISASKSRSFSMYPSSSSLGGTLYFNLHDYIARAYLSKRGGYRWRALRSGGLDRGAQVIFQRTMTRNANGSEATYVDKSIDGECYSSFGLEGDMLVDLPYYSHLRFVPSRTTALNGDLVDIGQFIATFYPIESTSFMLYSSAAEDFSLSNFVCTPVVTPG